MEAEGARGHSVLTAEGSLTCMCEGAERANQGQQEQQLNIHCGENFSPPVTTFMDSLGAEHNTRALAHAAAHTPDTHQPASPEGKGEGPKIKKVKNENKVFSGKLVKVAA